MPYKILLIAGLALCVCGIKAFLDARQFKASSIQVDAVVEEAVADSIWNRTPLAPRVALKYEYAGSDIRVATNAISQEYAALKKGDTIELVLMPSNPKRFMPVAALPRAGSLGIFLVIAGAGVFLLAHKMF